MSKTQRLFVGNLPPNIVDQELKNEFSSYGKVKEVEVKHKRGADDEIINTFAFLYIDIDGQSLKQCLQEFKNEKYKGRFLNVTVARENFLDKLKREREEAAKSGTAVTETANTGPIELVSTRPALPVLPVKHKVAESSSSEDDSSSEDEKPAAPRNPFGGSTVQKAVPVIPDEEVDEDGNLLLRKRSKAFLENGRIRIDARSSSGAGAIHVIERNKKEKKQFDDDKSKEADKKRLESLNKMKDTYNQQKLAIKNALSGVDSNRSNKIVFDPPVVSATPSAESAKKSKSNKPLFDDNDDEEDYSNDFRVKEQFQGEKGAQLMKLQSRFQNDKRFDMDTKFWEEGEETGEYAPEVPAPENEDDADDERKWQYGILESVMGKRIQSDPATEKKNPLQQTMPRYDPTKQDHTKYLGQAAAKRKPETTKTEPKSKKSKQEENVEPAPEFEVSKEQFFKVNKNLTSTLLKGNEAGGQFSLLSMFGTATEADASTGAKNSYREKLIATNSTQKVIEDMTNPFKYDSSDDEQEVPSKAKAADKPAVASGKVLPKSGTAVWHETFFIHGADDERMKEGLKFFLPLAEINVGELDMENRQKEMRNILKKKVKRSIKSVLPHGAKPNKRFRKFVRNL